MVNPKLSTGKIYEKRSSASAPCAKSAQDSQILADRVPSADPRTDCGPAGRGGPTGGDDRRRGHPSLADLQVPWLGIRFTGPLNWKYVWVVAIVAIACVVLTIVLAA